MNRLDGGCLVLAAVLSVSLTLQMALFTGERPILLLNLSDSAPKGLFLRVREAPEIGDWVAACLPEELAELGRERDYLRRGRLCPEHTAPVIKRLAAREGAHVALDEGALTIDAVPWPSGALRQLDRTNRPIPHAATYPYTLQRGEVLLLGETAVSWDGRYYGPVPEPRVLGVYRRVGLAALSRRLKPPATICRPSGTSSLRSDYRTEDPSVPAGTPDLSGGIHPLARVGGALSRSREREGVRDGAALAPRPSQRLKPPATICRPSGTSSLRSEDRTEDPCVPSGTPEVSEGIHPLARGEVTPLHASHPCWRIHPLARAAGAPS